MEVGGALVFFAGAVQRADKVVGVQQEHNMKAKNGGVGMTDDQVIAFIARCVLLSLLLQPLPADERARRYMPGYELFLEGVQSPEASWKGKGLKLVVGRGREIVGTEEF